MTKSKRASSTGPGSDPIHIGAFAPDAPLTDPALDRFKRHPFSERVARTLAHRTDPSSIVVHIHGAWGEGKTTVLAFIDQELQKFDHVVTVTFNPWRVTDQTALVLAFFNTIAAALDKAPKTLKEKIGDTLRQYGEIAGEFHLDVHGLKLTSGKALSRVGDLLSTITLEERRSRIEELLTKARTRIVVFLDDIDRLDRTEVQAVFKLLKLTANFINISFILAFDRDIVAHAIGTQFGAGNAQAGYEYLEKIIQVNLSLPVADPEALTKLCLDLLNTAIADARITLTAEQEKEFQLVFLQDIAPNLKTPRVAKLYANAVSFALPLFADELNPVDLLLLEALKCFHPTVHEHLRQNPGMYTGTFGWDMDLAINGNPECKAAIEFVINNQPATARHTQHLLTSLFPQLNELFHRGKYGSTSRTAFPTAISPTRKSLPSSPLSPRWSRTQWKPGTAPYSAPTMNSSSSSNSKTTSQKLLSQQAKRFVMSSRAAGHASQISPLIFRNYVRSPDSSSMTSQNASMVHHAVSSQLRSSKKQSRSRSQWPASGGWSCKATSTRRKGSSQKQTRTTSATSSRNASRNMPLRHHFLRGAQASSLRFCIRGK
jgi:hypothetical protein